MQADFAFNFAVITLTKIISFAFDVHALHHFFFLSGNDVVIVKNGRRICGNGAGLANAPIAQNKAYFEIKIQCTGKMMTIDSCFFFMILSFFFLFFLMAFNFFLIL